jgi:hypothetical protein
MDRSARSELKTLLTWRSGICVLGSSGPVAGGCGAAWCINGTRRGVPARDLAVAGPVPGRPVTVEGAGRRLPGGS